MYYCDEPMECYGCSDRDNKLEDIRYWFQGVLDQLYGQSSFDALELEWFLNELTSRLGMKLPHEPLAIVRENRIVELPTAMLESWKEYNTQYLKNLSQTGS